MISVSSYRRPGMLEEATDLMASGEFTPIAGGTDLLPALRHGGPANVLDICGAGLSFIRMSDGHLEIGAAVTHSRLCTDAEVRNRLPLLSRACGLIGSVQIRNRGTIGGNIVNASPCADTVPVLLNFDAELRLVSKEGERRVRLGDFIKGPYSTDRRPDELLYSIQCKIPEPNTGHAYIKLGRRQAVNISRMTLAASIFVGDNGIMENACIAGGSVFPIPSRMAEVEDLLKGQMPSDSLFEDAGNLAVKLMTRRSGQRWSTPYKMPVLTGLVKRVLVQATGG